MKTILLAISLAPLLLAALPGPARPGAAPKMSIHIEEYAELTCRDDMSRFTRDDLAATYAGVGRINAFVVIYDYEEVLGAAFGLTWPETWLDPMWQDCGAMRLGAIHRPGDRINVMLEECARGGEPLVVGWLSVTVTAPGTIELEPSQAEGAVAIVDCNHAAPAVLEVMFTGKAGAGGMKGTDPRRFAHMENRTWHVRADSTGDAVSLVRAVRQSIPGDTVAVAAGVYRGTVYLRNGVAIVGGWSPDFTQRDLEAFPSVIEPDGEQVCVIGGLAEDSTCVLDGFVITGGHGHYGGGLALRSGSSPVLRNLVVHGNRADLGGGIFCNASSPLIENVLLFGNDAEKGGGIACNMGASPRIVGCTIVANKAEEGAGIYANGAAPYVENSIIAHHGSGAGIHCATKGSRVTFACCDLWDNQPSDFGGHAGAGMGLRDNIAADPGFPDVEGLDFTLPEGSPCREVPNCGTLGSSWNGPPAD